MNTQKGNSVIGLIAVAAVAILVGIWIGAKTDIAQMDIETEMNSAVQRITHTKKQAVTTPETQNETTEAETATETA